MLKTSAFIILITIALTINSVAAPIKGAGATNCGQWIEDRKHGDHSAQLHWVMGFISSYNHFIYLTRGGTNPNGIFGNTEANAITVWMDNYCQRNPLDTVYSGAVELIDEMKPRAR